MWVPYHIALRASACEIAGQIEESSALLDEAFQIVERTGERWFEAELHRNKGQLLLRQGHPEAAEELYRKALSIAEKQEAKLWELRAAASLAQLRCDQGRHAEARNLLAPAPRLDARCGWPSGAATDLPVLYRGWLCRRVHNNRCPWCPLRR